MPDPIDDARQLIQSRLADISAEARQLERALVGLGEGPARKRRPGRPPKSASAVATAPRRKRAPRKPKRAKRAARGQRREELLAAVKANPGARPSELAREMGVRPTQVSVLIAKARAEKLVVKKGEGYALKG
jgi:MarR family